LIAFWGLSWLEERMILFPEDVLPKKNKLFPYQRKELVMILVKVIVLLFFESGCKAMLFVESVNQFSANIVQVDG